jgi:pseudomonalisin
MRFHGSVQRAAFVFALFVCLAAVPAAFGQTSWTSTATAGVTIANATDLGALPAQSPVHITAVLQLQNVNSLQALVKSMNTPGDPLYGTELSPDEFAAQYGSTASQVQAVSNYLTSAGFTNIQVEPNNLMVQADGTASAANAAFNTSLEEFSANGATVFANTRPAQVPAALGGIVAAVLGLNNASQVSTPISTCTTAGCALQSEPPQGFQTAYNVGTTASGSSTAIAIFTFGSIAGVVNDLRVAETQNKLPQVPVVVKQVGVASPNALGGGEWQLDSQLSTGMAGSVKTLYIYNVGDPLDADVVLMFNHFVTDKLARAGSASFGECEYGPYLDGAMLAADEVFLQGAAQGQTIFASTGDTGSSCPVVPVDTNGVPLSGAPLVNWPAASPYVAAVGGTSLLLDSSGNYANEIAWNAGGGGISQFEGCSFWQTNASIPSCTDNSRGVPDVAMAADPNTTGATIYYQCPANGSNASSCELQGVGGTSLSSPLSLGTWARLQSAHGNKLGYASPKLYQFYQPLSAPSLPVDPGYHDIIVGGNGTYVATPGWDFVTGLGSFNVAIISGLL